MFLPTLSTLSTFRFSSCVCVFLAFYCSALAYWCCACRVKSGHYVATHGRETPEPPYAHANRGYWTDGEESMRAPSERTISEYTVSRSRFCETKDRDSDTDPARLTPANLCIVYGSFTFCERLVFACISIHNYNSGLRKHDMTDGFSEWRYICSICNV